MSLKKLTLSLEIQVSNPGLSWSSCFFHIVFNILADFRSWFTDNCMGESFKVIWAGCVQNPELWGKLACFLSSA